MTARGRHALRWAASLAAVLTAHLAGAAALLAWRVPQEPPTASPAVMIDLADTPAAPIPDLNDIAPGPQQEISEPPPPESPTIVGETLARLLPQPEPPPPVRLPDPPQVNDQLPMPPEPQEVVLEVPPPKPAPPRPQRVPQRSPTQPGHTEKQPARPPKPDLKPFAAQTTAPSGAPTQQAAVAAPSPGVASPPSPSVVRHWQANLLAHLQRHKRYPGAARDKNEVGTVYLHFAMNRAGTVLTRDIARASGHPALDQETLAMLERAQPLPAPPADVAGERFEFVVPVQFQLR